MIDKKAIKEALLNEMSDKLDELLEFASEPKDLYELEKAISKLGNDTKKQVLEAIDEYNSKESKKKLSNLQQ